MTPVVTMWVCVAALAPMVLVKNSASALKVTWMAVEPLRMPLAALTTKVVLPTTL